jgi:hypothetical protein
MAMTRVPRLVARAAMLCVGPPVDRAGGRLGGLVEPHRYIEGSCAAAAFDLHARVHQVARHERRPECEGLLHLGSSADHAEPRRALQPETEQEAREFLHLGAVAVAHAEAQDSFVRRVLRRGAEPASVETDEVGARVLEFVLEAPPQELREVLGLLARARAEQRRRWR